MDVSKARSLIPMQISPNKRNDCALRLRKKFVKGRTQRLFQGVQVGLKVLPIFHAGLKNRLPNLL